MYAVLPDPATGTHTSNSPTVTLEDDGDNNVTKETDPLGYATSYTYTLLDQVATESQLVALSYTGHRQQPDDHLDDGHDLFVLQ